ncbi:hypothetical protein (plasmid) [Metabacillus dongyingensis]|nr:hypothetical protein [Metabacillus dongyingensis]
MKCFLSKNKQLYVNPVLILGRGYTFLRVIISGLINVVLVFVDGSILRGIVSLLFFTIVLYYGLRKKVWAELIVKCMVWIHIVLLIGFVALNNAGVNFRGNTFTAAHLYHLTNDTNVLLILAAKKSSIFLLRTVQVM